eukprot:scaffold43952_cov270-Isochrysis_galbana.AAC.3
MGWIAVGTRYASARSSDEREVMRHAGRCKRACGGVIPDQAGRTARDWSRGGAAARRTGLHSELGERSSLASRFCFCFPAQSPAVMRSMSAGPPRDSSLVERRYRTSYAHPRRRAGRLTEKKALQHASGDLAGRGLSGHANGGESWLNGSRRHRGIRDVPERRKPLELGEQAGRALARSDAHAFGRDVGQPKTNFKSRQVGLSKRRSVCVWCVVQCRASYLGRGRRGRHGVGRGVRQSNAADATDDRLTDRTDATRHYDDGQNTNTNTKIVSLLWKTGGVRSAHLIVSLVNRDCPPRGAHHIFTPKT